MAVGNAKSIHSRWEAYVPATLGGAAALIAALAVVGWTLDHALLKSGGESFVTMKLNTAVGLLGLSWSVILLAIKSDKSTIRKLAAVLSVTVAGLGILSIVESVLQFDFGIDQLIFHEGVDAIETFSPGRMAAITGFCFLISGTALFSLAAQYRRIALLPDVLLSVTILLSILVLLGYLFGEPGMRDLGMYGSMAINTAIAFLLVGLGGLALHTNQGLVASLASKTPAGIMLRWILPAAVCIPIGVGWLRWAGERQGLYGTGFGVALTVVTTIALLVILIRCGAAAIERAQRQVDSIEKSARENDLRLRALLDANYTSIYIFDRDSRFIYTNKHVDDLYQVGRSGLVGKTLFDMFPREQANVYHSHNGLVWQSGKAIEIEETATIPAGTRVYLSQKFPICDKSGVMIALGGISYDITERKQMEENLRHSEERIAELNEDLLKQNLQLQAANTELESFSYSVSHDLRAPLRSIDGFSQALLEDVGGTLDDTANEYLRRVRAASQRMGLLIDDLLKMSRISRLDVDYHEVNLSAMGAQIISELREKHPDRRVEATICPKQIVKADERLMRIVLENLLENAWKYTSKRPHATIEFGCEDQSGTRVHFVRDNGAGYDMAYAQKLFGAFQRLHNSQDFDGTGIGLATVQRIIHRHGGTVWGEGAVDKGATFYFTIGPLNEERLTNAKQSYSAGRGQPGRRAVDPART